MEGDLLRIIRDIVRDREPESRRFRHKTSTILLVGQWAIMNDRPMCWACEPCHWPDALRPERLPHPSTLSRRWRSETVQQAARKSFAGLINKHQETSKSRYAAIDGRPLLVGGATKDRQARSGRAVRGMGIGYKLHAVVDARKLVIDFIIEPLSVNEQKPAKTLLARLPPHITHVLADGAYDAMTLHTAAAQANRKLYAPVRGNYVGRRQQPRRVALLRLSARKIGKRLMASRDEIERVFALMSNVGFGYKGLPPWARGLHRVTRWLWGKLMLYHAYQLKQRAKN